MRSAAGLIFRLAAFFCAGMAGMKEENVNFSPGISGKKGCKLCHDGLFYKCCTIIKNRKGAASWNVKCL